MIILFALLFVSIILLILLKKSKKIDQKPDQKSVVFYKKKKAGIAVSTQWDTFFIDPIDWPKSFEIKFAKQLEFLIELRNKYGFKFLIDENSGRISLIYNFFFTNFDTEFSFRSDCSIEMYPSANADDQYFFSYDIMANVFVEGELLKNDSDENSHSLDNQTVELYLLDISEIDTQFNKRQIENFAKKMHDATLEAMNHEMICAKFPIDHTELPKINGYDDHNIFDIEYQTHNNEIEKDRICRIRRSIFSISETNSPKWIEAYSEKNRCYRDYKIKNFRKIRSNGKEIIF